MASDDRVVVEFDQHSTEYRETYPAKAHELREQCPVAWSTNHDGFWVVTGHDQLSALSKRTDLLSNDHDPNHERNGYQGISIPERGETRGGFIEMDPPEQSEYRRVLNPFLSPAAVGKWEPLIADFGDDPARLEDEIRVTVVHELGHHFGLDEDELERLGWA